MAFTDTQVQALSGKLSARHVRTRQANGRTLSYIEGWHVVADAHRIFGFDAWARQTMANKCVWEGTWQGKYSCAYVARVRVKVRAGSVEICREGCGSGHGRAQLLTAVGAVGEDRLQEGKEAARLVIQDQKGAVAVPQAGRVDGARIRPRVSTRRWRFLPLTFLPAPVPTRGPDTRPGTRAASRARA